MVVAYDLLFELLIVVSVLYEVVQYVGRRIVVIVADIESYVRQSAAQFLEFSS